MDSRPEGPRELASEPVSDTSSRGLSGRGYVGFLGPGESACGLIPGLRSPGPLGRTGRRFVRAGECLDLGELARLRLPAGAQVEPLVTNGRWGSCPADIAGIHT